VSASTLPLHHRDPFDRMLIGQAKHEGMQLITLDAQFQAYDVPLIGS
jgi:PIN domain nuclease of toxin-antitoxin system